jgi:AcrR family transcriptional regulator
MAKKVDLRVIKTQRLIREAFFELMREVGFQKTNVRKIVERAQINRSTFYLHYLDKFDLLDKLEDDLFSGMKNIISEVPAEQFPKLEFSSKKLQPLTLRMADYIYENGKILKLLMGKKGDPMFLSKFGATVQSVWVEKKILKLLSVPQGYALAAITGMMTSLISEWLKRGLRETPEEFTKIVSKIVKGIPQNVFSGALVTKG